mmetsp:Transcript_104188/g.277212  ORF Transcript_104188/g.277212 Transcript_104188/m.277212 type:complete len:379 (-) Transcript_104188:106-1242(-)
MRVRRPSCPPVHGNLLATISSAANSGTAWPGGPSQCNADASVFDDLLWIQKVAIRPLDAVVRRDRELEDHQAVVHLAELVPLLPYDRVLHQLPHLPQLELSLERHVHVLVLFWSRRRLARDARGVGRPEVVVALGRHRARRAGDVRHGPAVLLLPVPGGLHHVVNARRMLWIVVEGRFDVCAVRGLHVQVQVHVFLPSQEDVHGLGVMVLLFRLCLGLDLLFCVLRNLGVCHDECLLHHVRLGLALGSSLLLSFVPSRRPALQCFPDGLGLLVVPVGHRAAEGLHASFEASVPRVLLLEQRGVRRACLGCIVCLLGELPRDSASHVLHSCCELLCDGPHGSVVQLLDGRTCWTRVADSLWVSLDIAGLGLLLAHFDLL